MVTDLPVQAERAEFIRQVLADQRSLSLMPHHVKHGGIRVPGKFVGELLEVSTLLSTLPDGVESCCQICQLYRFVRLDGGESCSQSRHIQRFARLGIDG